MRHRYQVQRLNAVNVWEDVRGRNSSIGENLVYRMEADILRGTRPEDIRIWDTQENTQYIAEPPRILTEEEINQQIIRQAAARAAAEENIRIERATAVANLAQYNAERATAAANLAQKTVNSTDEYTSLPEIERNIIIDRITTAYNDTDIDGYGDEGAGYNVDQFIQTLLNSGWSYNPQ